ncbi:hypothetical protein FFWV33_16680 [Flavobacterium faecale]|uniref:CDP-glycerol--glycerophosphate glycerophosphotransferase n=1 Tax=Flavobacterium faecale TaxID=1355330 RepID=A0A2S1LGX4_9FLAO|nr:hypothetical protein [Flavobacterium faecale]AWG23042.1 hypothetical protein FFWV33_16680 [Flavobacterium faecale]
MINSIIKFITGKEIILCDKHRQIEPLAKNSSNKKNYYFFDIGLIWRYIPFKTSDKKKHKIMYFILSCIQPKYIISMNWQTQRESLYKVWTAKRNNSKFIVIQHGVYVGGTVTDVPHKYTKCDIFLTWGPYFTTEFSKFNSLKKVEVFNFGNSIYNNFNRDNYKYKSTRTNKILILPTALDAKNILYVNVLIKKLQELKFEVFVKEHGKQGVEKDRNGLLKYPNIEAVTKITGQLYSILQNNDYDFIIADHSSSLLDAIFFKNKVLYCDPNNKSNGYTTQYSKYLANVFLDNYSLKYKNYFEDLLNISNQEALLAEMISTGNNELDNKFHSN